MPVARVAAWLSSYRRGLKESLHSAAGDGFQRLHANTTSPEFNPADFSRSAQRHFLRYLRDLGLSLDGVATEFPGLGLADPKTADQRMDQVRQSLELAAQLGVQDALVTVRGFCDAASVGVARESLHAVATLADRYNLRVAIQSAADDPVTVADELRRIDCPLLRVGLDAAALTGGNDAAGRAASSVGVVHVRDVRRNGDEVEETPFGSGEVDLAGLFAALAGGGYDGAFVVRRNLPSLGVDAMRQGREYIDSLLRSSGARL